MTGQTNAFAFAASCLVACAAFTGSATGAQPGSDDEETPARPLLISASDGLVAGATNTLAVSFDLDEGWHVYWPGQNATGFAPSIELTLPEGWEAGETLWPAPHRYISPGGILDHVYERGEATFLIPLTIPEDAETGPVRLTADLEWLVCREACIPGWETVTLETRVLPAGARVAPSGHTARFEAARKRLAEPFRPAWRPRALPPTRAVTLGWDGGVLTIAPAEKGLQRAPVSIAFYPDDRGSAIAGLLESGASASKAPGTLPGALRLRREDPSKPVSGIVEVGFGKGVAPALYRIETRPAGEPSTPDAGG
jgi:hypothetical protein